MGQYRIPALSDENIRAALQLARVTLSQRRTAAFKRRINEALTRYAVSQLVNRERRSTTPSKVRVRLSQIERAATRADAARAIALLRDASSDAAIQEMRRLAIVCGKPNPDFEHDLAVLHDLARRAGLRVAARILGAKSRIAVGKLRERRNTGNQPMQALFGTLNTLWVTYFRRIPGITRGRGSEPGGPYARFVRSVLHGFARRIGADIQRDFPRFKRGLLLTPQAIHGYFRRTGISKFRTADPR